MDGGSQRDGRVIEASQVYAADIVAAAMAENAVKRQRLVTLADGKRTKVPPHKMFYGGPKSAPGLGWTPRNWKEVNGKAIEESDNANYSWIRNVPTIMRRGKPVCAFRADELMRYYWGPVVWHKKQSNSRIQGAKGHFKGPSHQDPKATYYYQADRFAERYAARVHAYMERLANTHPILTAGVCQEVLDRWRIESELAFRIEDLPPA